MSTHIYLVTSSIFITLSKKVKNGPFLEVSACWYLCVLTENLKTGCGYKRGFDDFYYI